MLTIVYDGDCPFCSDYISRLKLQTHCGPITLINAREQSPSVAAYWHAGFDLDQGMVAVLDGHEIGVLVKDLRQRIGAIHLRTQGWGQFYGRGRRRPQG